MVAGRGRCWCGRIDRAAGQQTDPTERNGSARTVRAWVPVQWCVARCAAHTEKPGLRARILRRARGQRALNSLVRVFLLRRKSRAILRVRRPARCRTRAALREEVAWAPARLLLRGFARCCSKRRQRQRDRAKSGSRNPCAIWTWGLRAAL